MKMKLNLILISVLLLSTFALGCIDKIEPSSNSKVVLDKNHPYQTYVIYIESTESKGYVEVSIDDVLQTTIQLAVDKDTYAWTIYGNNFTKGDHELKFHDGEGNSVNRYITNNIGNEIVINSTNKTDPVDFSTLLPGLINLTIVILLLIIMIIFYKIIKKLKAKGPVFKDLVLTCTNCRDRDIYHNFKKEDLIDVYKCHICGGPRIIDTDMNIERRLDEPPYDKMVEFSDEEEHNSDVKTRNH